MKESVLNVSFPKTMDDFSPDETVYTCIGTLDLLGEHRDCLWKAAFDNESALRKHCFWFGERTPCIKPPIVRTMTAKEFVEKSYTEDPRGMNPFEAVNRLEFMAKWALKEKATRV